MLDVFNSSGFFLYFSWLGTDRVEDGVATLFWLFFAFFDISFEGRTASSKESMNLDIFMFALLILRF